jgi:hypothetical protein
MNWPKLTSIHIILSSASYGAIHSFGSRTFGYVTFDRDVPVVPITSKLVT